VEVPNVTKKEYELVNIDDGFMSLMNDAGDMKEDLKLPPGELGEQIQAAFDDGKELQIVVQTALGQEMAVSMKVRVRTIARDIFVDSCRSFARLLAQDSKAQS